MATTKTRKASWPGALGAGGRPLRLTCFRGHAMMKTTPRDCAECNRINSKENYQKRKAAKLAVALAEQAA